MSETVCIDREHLGGEAAQGAPRLDCEENKSTRWDDDVATIFVPVRSGGRLHPTDGLAARCRDLERFAYLIDRMGRPHLLTLTVDRERFSGPAEAWSVIARRLSQLLSQRLGCRVWGRVLEIQTATGDGWPHVHVLVDLAGSGLSLSSARRRCWKFWRDEWGVGGVDLQRVQHRRGAAKYLAKYVVKGMAAVPEWMLLLVTSPRLVGWSKEANDMLRAGGLRRIAVRGMPRRKRKYKPRGPVLDRLAVSGKRTTVLRLDPSGVTTFVGTLPCAPAGLLSLQSELPDVEIRPNQDGRARLVSCLGWGALRVRRASRLLNATGVAADYQGRAVQEREAWLHSWDLLQDEQERRLP